MIERIFREEHGRAVAVLTRACGDIGLAEEAVQEAFAAALARWPVEGLPPSPAGWIITTARRRAVDWLRRESTRSYRQRARTGIPGATVVRDPERVTAGGRGAG